MIIVIDLLGDDEVIQGEDLILKEKDAKRKHEEDVLKWIKYNEQVLPQVIPVAER